MRALRVPAAEPVMVALAVCGAAALGRGLARELSVRAKYDEAFDSFVRGIGVGSVITALSITGISIARS